MHHRCLIVLASLLMLVACQKEGGQFRLEGEFRNMNQAELYLFDPVSGQKDTISVVRGRFSYQSNRPDSVLLMLMFPNYSAMPVFACNGMKLSLKGDASHLRETRLKGSAENDQMTDFRLKAAQLTPPEEQQAAAEYIRANAQSAVSLYLLRHYFIEGPQPDYPEAQRLCRLMVQASPRNTTLLRLNQQLKTLAQGRVGTPAPCFAVLDTKGRPVTTADLKGTVGVVCLWSSWSSESRQLVQAVHRMQRTRPGKITLLAVSIDANGDEGRQWLSRDTIDRHVVCDGLIWKTPLAQALGLTTVPGNVLVSKGRIAARDILNKDDLEKEIDRLLAAGNDSAQHQPLKK